MVGDQIEFDGLPDLSIYPGLGASRTRPRERADDVGELRRAGGFVQVQWTKGAAR
jgi:hypothetical protein